MPESFTNPENTNKPEWYDAAKSPIEADLHNKGLDISLASEPVVDRQQAIEKYGINGDVIAVIALPAGKNGEPKQVAFVDHGEDFEGQPAILFGGKGLGRSESRYALFGLNYSPQSHMFPYASLRRTETTVGRGGSIGREDGVNDHVSYLLGLNEKGNDYISGSHFTIKIEDDLQIFDHSTNHTKVYVNK